VEREERLIETRWPRTIILLYGEEAVRNEWREGQRASQTENEVASDLVGDTPENDATVAQNRVSSGVDYAAMTYHIARPLIAGW
jgi:hypothetical protein